MQGSISHLDLYASSADSQLTLDGKRKISSVAGGVCTVLAFTFICWFIGIQILNITDDDIYKI